MTPAFIIARADDAPRMATLHAAAAENAWPVHAYRDLLKLNTTLALAKVRESDETLTAFILCQIAVDTADILMVATHPEQRRKGLAHSLTQSLIKRLGERGIARLTLDVAANNAPAIALYKGLGFIIDGRRPKYYTQGQERIDALLMSRPVTGLSIP